MRASPLPLATGLTRGRRRRSVARGLSQGPPLLSLAVCVGCGRGRERAQRTGGLEQGVMLRFVARPPSRGRAGPGRPTRPGYGGVQLGVQVEAELVRGGRGAWTPSRAPARPTPSPSPRRPTDRRLRSMAQGCTHLVYRVLLIILLVLNLISKFNFQTRILENFRFK